MLASLERDGKTPGQVSTKRTRSRTRIGLVALAIVAVGGAGAFFALAPGDDAMGSSVQVAAAPHKAAAASQAIATVALSSSDAASIASSSPSTPAAIEQAATPAIASSAAVAAANMASGAGSSAAVAVAQAGGNPLDKLALTDAPTEPAKGRYAHDKDKASAKPHEETVGSAKKPLPHAAVATASHKAKREDDADTELVAAIIARLDRRGAQPPAGASGVVVAAAPTNVSDVVRRCSQNADLVEARQCRSRACENHWGKIDACPASRAPKTSQAEGGANGKRG